MLHEPLTGAALTFSLGAGKEPSSIFTERVENERYAGLSAITPFLPQVVARIREAPICMPFPTSLLFQSLPQLPCLALDYLESSDAGDPNQSLFPKPGQKFLTGFLCLETRPPFPLMDSAQPRFPRSSRKEQIPNSSRVNHCHEECPPPLQGTD